MNIVKILLKLRKPATAILKDKDRSLQFLEKVKAKLATVDAPNIKALRNDSRSTLQLIRAYVTGDYRNVPWQTMLSLTGALIYFFNPLDIIPDFIPLKGFLDDAAVLAFVFSSFRSDLEQFASWRKEQDLAADTSRSGSDR